MEPYNGIGLPLLSHAAETDIPVMSLLLYLCKALIWILLPAVMTGKRKKTVK